MRWRGAARRQRLGWVCEGAGLSHTDHSLLSTEAKYEATNLTKIGAKKLAKYFPGPDACIIRAYRITPGGFPGAPQKLLVNSAGFRKCPGTTRGCLVLVWQL